MDFYVAVIRNGLCVVKALLPKSNVVMKPLPNLSIEPIGPDTSIIEYVIAVSQFYAVWSYVNSGLTNMTTGYANYQRFSRMIYFLDRKALQSSGPELCVVRHGVVVEKYNSALSIYAGCCEFVIGVGFIFLVLKSLHIHGPTYPKVDSYILQKVTLFYNVDFMSDYFNTFGR